MDETWWEIIIIFIYYLLICICLCLWTMHYICGILPRCHISHFHLFSHLQFEWSLAYVYLNFFLWKMSLFSEIYCIFIAPYCLRNCRFRAVTKIVWTERNTLFAAFLFLLIPCCRFLRFWSISFLHFELITGNWSVL